MSREVGEQMKWTKGWLRGGMVLGVGLWSAIALATQSEAVAKNSKQTIGATATIKEASSGLPFSARIDTGATTCSIHALDWKIEKPGKRPALNVGKPIRVLIANEKGEEAWVDAVVAARVRVRSSVQDEDDYHGRYKVLLPLEYNGVTKEVLVTINDRTNMEYPLLIGRNFLRGDFVVDVDVDNQDVADAEN
jgi:hypothetical protein